MILAGKNFLQKNYINKKTHTKYNLFVNVSKSFNQ